MHALSATLYEPDGTRIDDVEYEFPTEQFPDEAAAREEMREVWHFYNVAFSCECRWGEVVVREVEGVVA